MISFTQNIFLPQNIFLLLLIFCTGLMACVFTSKRQSHSKTCALVVAIIAATFAICFVTNIIVFFAIILSVLGAVFFATFQGSAARKVLIIYGAIFLSVAILLCLSGVNEVIIFYSLLIPFLGLFPFQTWYINFYKHSSFGAVAAFVAFQGVVILVGESFFKIEDASAM